MSASYKIICVFDALLHSADRIAVNMDVHEFSPKYSFKLRIRKWEPV